MVVSLLYCFIEDQLPSDLRMILPLPKEDVEQLLCSQKGVIDNNFLNRKRNRSKSLRISVVTEGTSVISPTNTYSDGLSKTIVLLLRLRHFRSF